MPTEKDIMEFKSIALKSTQHGWAIGLIQNTYNGKYAVIRVAPDNKFVVISKYVSTEAEVRKLGNKVYKEEMTALRSAA